MFKKTVLYYLIFLCANVYSADLIISIDKTDAKLKETISPEILDMGSIRPEEKKVMEILLKNNSGEELIMNNWRSPCTCLKFSEVPDKLEAGADKKLSLTLDGENYRGNFTKHMFISLRTKDSNIKKDFFLQIKFAIKEGTGNVSMVQPDLAIGGKTKFIEYEDGGLEKYKNAAAWIFAGKTCPNCAILKKELLPKLLEQEGLDKAEIVLVDIDKKENFLFLVDLESNAGTKGDKTPVLYWKDKLYYGNEKIKELILE